MAKENETAASPLLRGLFTTGIYKRSQGRISRQATFAALAVIIGLGTLRMYETFFSSEQTLFGVVPGWILPLSIFVAGTWLVFRLVNAPRFADFLISVEAEMYKVSWPTRTELVRASLVVIITMFGLAAVLVAYDFIWQQLLGRVLGISGVLGGG